MSSKDTGSQTVDSAQDKAADASQCSGDKASDAVDAPAMPPETLTDAVEGAADDVQDRLGG